MIRRTTGFALLFGAGLVVLAWRLAQDSGRTAPPLQRSVAEGASDTLDSLALEPPAAPSTATRESPRDAELARGSAVEGRVEFPPGWPSREPVRVLARGKALVGGGHDEIEVGPDGNFRVVFAPGTRSGSLELRGACLLAEPLAWRHDATGPFVFRPTLGAHLRGTLSSSKGLRPRPGDEVELVEARPVHDSSPTVRLRADVSVAGEFEFPAVPELEFAYLVYRGAELLGERTVGPFSKGSSQTVELPVKPGIVLAGRALVAPDTGLGGVHVAAKRTTPPKLSAFVTTDATGRFRFAPLEPGAWEVTARAEGYLVAKLEVSVPVPGARSEDLELTLARGGSLAGRLLWTDGTPVEGRIEVAGLDRPDVHHARSAADGRFELTGLAAQRYRVRAEASRQEEVLLAPGAEPLERSTRLLTQLDDVPVGARELELRFQLGLTLDGRVLDEDGVPVERCSLHVVPVPPGSVEPGLPFSLLRVRDPLGRFQLAGLASGAWRLQASAPGYQDSLPVEFEVPRSTPVELVLRSSVRLVGRVLDASGSPVQGAEIEFGGRSSLESEWTTSGPDGGFVFEPLAPRFGRLRARSRGHAPSDWVGLEVRRDLAQVVELRLKAAGLIEGLFVDQAGQPLAGHYLSLRGCTVEYEESLVSGADGRFRFADLAAGEYALEASLPGTRLREQVLVESGAAVKVRLASPAQLQRALGVLRFDGVPVTGASVSCGNSSARTDAQGEFALLLPGPGEQVLWITHDNGDDELVLSCTVEAAPSTTPRLELAFTLARLRGRVSTGEAGRVQAHVLAESEDRSFSSWARCAEDGSFALRVLPGATTLRAQSWGDGSHAPAARNVRAEPGQVLEGLELTLTPGASLGGRVCLESGTPVEGVVVSCSRGSERELAFTNPFGEFEWRGLAPGTWRVQAHGPGLATRAQEVVALAEDDVRRLVLTLIPAATLEVRLPEMSGPDLGQLTLFDAAGQILAGPLEADENAHFGPLEPGRHRVRFELDEKQREYAIEVLAGSAFVLTLDNP